MEGDLVVDRVGGSGKASPSSTTETELFVFVSSTGDLAVERQGVRAVIDRVNARLEAAGFRQRLRPVMWEDLPPGEAPEGDFQAFIEALLKQFERDHFAIYLGFAKRRLGSQTPRYPSGTVEEFEDSLAARRKSGWPREVFFYFIADPTPEAGLTRWKRELEQRGYLYQDTTAEAFDARVEQALYDVASTWNRLGVRLRRVARTYARPTGFAAAAAVILFAAYVGWASLRAYGPLSQGRSAEACQFLQSDGRFMIFDPFGIRSQIDRTLAEATKPNSDAQALLRNLESLAVWQSCPTNHDGIEGATAKLADAVRDEVEYSDDDVALLRAARGVALFAGSPDDWRKLPRMAAARRLFDLHVAGADDPFDRLDTRLSPAEREAVKEFAQARSSNVPNVTRALAAASGDQARIVNTVLDLDDQTAGAFVLSAIQHLSPTGRSELVNVVWPTGAGSARQTQEWLAALIADGVARVRPSDPQLLGEVILRLQSGATPITMQAIADTPDGIRAGEFRHVDLENLLDDRKNFKWLKAIALLAANAPGREPVLGACATLRYASEIAQSPGIDGLSDTTLDALKSLGFAQLTTEEGLVVSLIKLFGRVRGKCSDRVPEPFAELMQQYAEGRTGFGFAQKAALIEAFASEREMRDARLAIVSRALDEAASQTGILAPDPEPVENAWFDSLRSESDFDKPELVALLDRIVDRRAAARTVRDPLPMGRMLLGLPDTRLLEMLRYPAPPLLDPPWSTNWSRRDVLIEALSDYNMSTWGTSGRPMPEVADAILSGLPAVENEADHRKLLEEQAWYLRGGDTTTRLGGRAEAGDLHALRLIANLSPAFLMQIGGLVPKLDDAGLAEVVAGMDDRTSGPCASFHSCHVDVSYQLCDLLWMRPDRFRDNEQLRIQLFRALTSALDKSSDETHRGSSRRSVANWIEEQSLATGDLAWLTAQSHFFAEDPQRLLQVWRSRTGGGPIDAVAATLAAADQIDWLFLSQDLIRLSEQGASSSVWPIASAQALAIVAHREEGTLAVHGLPLEDEIVTNPFLASYAIGDAEPADIVARLLAMMSRADLLSDETIGSTAAGPRFGGFLRWALARAAEHGRGACLPMLPDPLIGLDNSHPAIRAGQASLAIAAKENLLLPNCLPARQRPRPQTSPG